MKLIRNLPNILSLFNLFLGCMAIVYIFSDHMIIYQQSFDTHAETALIHPSNMHFAAYCIFIAAIIDFCDGFIARLLKAESLLGKQLDSLADMVTFGLVPGLLLFKLFQYSYNAGNNAFDYPLLFAATGFAITVFSAIRLARFNIDETQAKEFRGMPTPAAALIIAAFAVIVVRNEMNLNRYLTDYRILLVITALLCWLMVSNIRMMSLKLNSFNPAKNQWLVTLIIAEIVLLAAGAFVFHAGFILIPLALTLYIVLSVVKNIREYGI